MNLLIEITSGKVKYLLMSFFKYLKTIQMKHKTCQIICIRRLKEFLLKNVCVDICFDLTHSCGGIGIEEFK